MRLIEYKIFNQYYIKRCNQTPRTSAQTENQYAAILEYKALF